MSLHSVFGAAPPPGSYTLYSDAPPWIHLGTTFYGVDLPAGARIVGGRQWIPAGTGGGSLTMQLRLLVQNGVNDLLSAPVQTKVVNWTGDGKWVEGTFDVPQDVPANQFRWMISYRMGVDGRYVSSLDARPSPGNRIKASDNTELYLSEYLYPTSPQGPVHGRQFTIGGDPIVFSAADTGGYGTDTIIEIPDGPVNIGPVANAGPDQVVEEGETVTLSGSGTDADGLVTGYLWQQTAGAAVALGGSGQNRTFGAPAGPAVLTFRLTVTDDQGAIGQDTMTVTVLEAVEPEPPSSSDYELQINRENTTAFIAADPIEVSFERREKIDTGDGGHKFGPPSNVPSQRFRLIPQSDIMPQVQTPDGKQLTPTYVLLGEWDCDMKRWDFFSINDVDFQIVSPIRPDFRTSGVYEKKADVARR